jgi:hypothetical protein
MPFQMDRDLKVKISEICALLDVDGIRGDITTNKAARALAAYLGDAKVTLEHVKAVIGLCLNHRYAPHTQLDLLSKYQLMNRHEGLGKSFKVIINPHLAAILILVTIMMAGF